MDRPGPTPPRTGGPSIVNPRSDRERDRPRDRRTLRDRHEDRANPRTVTPPRRDRRAAPDRPSSWRDDRGGARPRADRRTRIDTRNRWREGRDRSDDSRGGAVRGPRPELRNFRHPRLEREGRSPRRPTGDRHHRGSSRTVTNITSITKTTHNNYYFNQRTYRHYNKPHFGSWWTPYKKPKSKTSAFFAIHFGHPGFSLKFSKYGHKTHWHWWYGFGSPAYCWPKYHYGYVHPTWVYPTWWRPTTICHSWYPRRVSYVHHVYAAPSTVVKYVDVPRDACAYTFGDAWSMIAASDADAALSAFGCLAADYPYDGLAHLGYGIAHAMLGNNDAAVGAMRHAMAIDAESIRFVPADEQLDEQLFLLADRASELAAAEAWRIDGLFMAATLQAGYGDYAGAHFAVSEAIRQGDNDEAAHNLRDTLEQLLKEQLYGS